MPEEEGMLITWYLLSNLLSVYKGGERDITFKKK